MKVLFRTILLGLCGKIWLQVMEGVSEKLFCEKFSESATLSGRAKFSQLQEGHFWSKLRQSAVRWFKLFALLWYQIQKRESFFVFLLHIWKFLCDGSEKMWEKQLCKHQGHEEESEKIAVSIPHPPFNGRKQKRWEWRWV